MADRVQEQLAAEEDAARRVAHIVGPNSAAAQAIEELERRRAAGEKAYVLRVKRSWVVGPMPGPTPANGVTT
jgi:hypothetical protein